MPIPKHSKSKCDLLACFGVFWRVLAYLASINARGCNIAMLGDVTSGAELDVVLKENDRTIYTKNN